MAGYGMGSSQKSDKEEVPGVMAPLREEIMELQPYISSEKNFVNPKNQKKIAAGLANLKALSSNLKTHDRLKTPGFAISAKVLQEQLTTASEIFNQGSKKLALRYVNASLKACSSCHTQVVSQGGPNWSFPLDRVSGSLTEQANFWYTIRYYDKAVDLYERAILLYPKGGLELKDVNEALEKILAVYLRVRRSPGRAIDALEKSYQNKKLPESLRIRIQSWVDQMKAINLSAAPSSRSATPKEVENYAAKILGKAEKESLSTLDDSHLVDFLFVSGLLYEFINFNPDKTTPEILYWLAIADSWLNDQFYFSLSNLYLEECIKRYPTSPTANRCFNELKEKTELNFTGSSGVNMPDDVRNYLASLDKILKDAQKKK